MPWYNVNAVRTHGLDSGRSNKTPASARRYAARVRATKYAIAVRIRGSGRLASSSERETPNAASSSSGRYRRPRSRSSPTSRRKFVSWNASPSAIAPGSASDSGPIVPNTGSICRPITAAEPYMYSPSSANVRYSIGERSSRIDFRNAVNKSRERP